MDYLNLISIATIGLSLIEAGGLMMWLLLGLSVLVFTCLIERTFHFHRAQIKHEGFIDGIKNTLGKQRRTEALALCDQAPGPVSAIVKAMLMACEKGEEGMLRIAETTALQEVEALERRLGLFVFIARIAPLIGLLGTVIGLIEAFTSLHSGGVYANLGVLSGGVREALLPTGFGLGVTIFAVAAHYFLHARLRSLIYDIEWATQEMIYYLTDYQVSQ